MKFEDLEYVWVFLVLTGLTTAMFYLVFWKRKKIIDQKLGRAVFLKLFPSWNGKMWPPNSSLIVGGVALCAFSLLNPQWGAQTARVSAKGIDLYIALDISNSMMATDVSPSRLEKAKKVLTELLDEVNGYRVGLIYFAGSAYLQMPVSADLSVAKLLIKSANPYQAGNQGTSIAESIDMAVSTFEKDNQNSKVVLIVTDGETHDEASVTSAKKAEEMGITVYCLGVGTTEGGLIPYGNGFKTDENNEPVRTVLNKDLVNEIAEAGGGISGFIDNTKFDWNSLAASIEDKAKNTLTTTETYNVKGSRYQWPLGFGILMLLIGMFYTQKPKVTEQ